MCYFTSDHRVCFFILNVLLESSESDDNESDFEIEVKPKKPKKATVQKEKPQRITNKVPKKSLPPTTPPPVQIKSQNKIASKRILTEKSTYVLTQNSKLIVIAFCFRRSKSSISHFVHAKQRN